MPYVIEDVNVRIGEKIKEIRESEKCSLDKVAEACEVEQYQTVSCWEKGRAIPIAKLLMFCNFAGCEVGYLLGEDGYELKTRAKTDIRKATGLSKDAIDAIIERYESNEIEQIEVLSSLLCNPDFWKVLKNMRNGIESKNHCMDGKEKNYIRYRKDESGESIVLKGEHVANHFKNTAINTFTGIVESTIGKTEA